MKKFNKIIFLMIAIITFLGLTITTVDAAPKNTVNNIESENTIVAVENVVSDNIKTNENNNEESKGMGIGLIAAALATGLACLGAGIAVAVVASSAVGAISENPSLLGKTIIFAGLAEGIAIYGLIISIMILNKI